MTLAGAAAAATLALTACGSSGSSRPSGAGDHATGVKFASCLRAHGLTSFPDPLPSSGGIQFPDSVVQLMRSPAGKTAQAACQHLLPQALPPPTSAKDQQAAVRFAQCMRTHGVPNMADPKYVNGRRLATPPPAGVNPASPAYQRAAKVCSSTPGTSTDPTG